MKYQNKSPKIVTELLRNRNQYEKTSTTPNPLTAYLCRALRRISERPSAPIPADVPFMGHKAKLRCSQH